MTPKEKAKELIDKLKKETIYEYDIETLKKYALIFIEEILCNSTFLISNGEAYFWNEVKKEILCITSQMK